MNTRLNNQFVPGTIQRIINLVEFFGSITQDDIGRRKDRVAGVQCNDRTELEQCLPEDAALLRVENQTNVALTSLGIPTPPGCTHSNGRLRNRSLGKE